MTLRLMGDIKPQAGTLIKVDMPSIRSFRGFQGFEQDELMHFGALLGKAMHLMSHF